MPPLRSLFGNEEAFFVPNNFHQECITFRTLGRRCKFVLFLE